MIHTNNFCFEILHTITSLCLEKSDGAQFLKKILIITKWTIFTPTWAQKTYLLCSWNPLSRFLLALYDDETYSYIKNFQWNSPKYVLFR